ncbi:hypothetical protein C810_00959 [Lachnospiraceae bacterium A2]|nr:hypothetical protein C810_00959 [Lachnospiraceae bacterium A2]
MDRAPVIELQEVTKDYGNGKGVFGLSFAVPKGEVFGYLGPNGAGKTTTIRQLMGFIRPSRGICRMMGMDCFLQAQEIQKHTGYLAGELAFPEDMTGLGFLKFMADMKGMDSHRHMESLMERFGLNPHGRIKRMSKGMKQKIGIVNAFMHQPEVVILDEPTSGLDPLMQNEFVELVLEEKKKGTTILMSSHIFEEVEKTCDRTAIIRSGRIATVEDMKELAGKRKKIYRVMLPHAAAAEKLLQEPGIQPWSHPGAKESLPPNQAEFTVSGSLPDVLRKLADFGVQDLEARNQSMEELFFQYYG